MNTILVAGYKSFDVGVFSNKDPRLTIIKKAIERDLRRLLGTRGRLCIKKRLRFSNGDDLPI